MKKYAEYVFLAVTFVLVTAAAILTRQPFFRYLPLCVSMLVNLLQSRVNRYAHLLGSLNSLLYAAVYIGLRIYASAASALLLSFPMQMITRLRRMNGKGRVLTLLLFAAAWTVVYLILHALGSASIVLDNTATLLGILVYILTMFSFIEYTFLQIVVNLVSIFLQASLLKENPGQVTYMMMTVYSTVFAVRAVFRAHTLYQKQRREKNHEYA